MKALYSQSQWQQSQNISPQKALDTWAIQRHYTGWNNYVDENKQKVNTDKVKGNVIQTIRNKGISDTELYAYAGYEYIHGADPTLINPEHPPLGKYLIGMSILAFRNENVILLFFGFILIVAVFTIVYLETKRLLPASVAVFLTATHTLFIDQLIHGPQLELFQTTFFLVFLLALQLYDKKRRYVYIFIAGIVLGWFLSVKTFSTHFLLAFALLLLLLKFSRRFKIRDFLIVNALGFLMFMGSYASFFIHGGTIRKWLGVQKYIVLFYKQSGIDIVAFIGNYLRLIVTGYWKFWSGNNPVSHYGQWSFMWPFVFAVGSFCTLRLLVIKRKSMSLLEMSLVFFIVLYNLFLFVVPIFPRYLLLLFIPMTILIGVSINSFINHETK